MRILILMVAFIVIVKKLWVKQEAPAQQRVEVEISDPTLVEEIQNLREMQEVYNAKIFNMQKLNAEYQAEINKCNNVIQNNYENVRIQMRLNPSSDLSILTAQCDASNEDYLKRRTRLEGLILNNEEKIVQFKQKSNTISAKIDKIGHTEYEKQMK